MKKSQHPDIKRWTWRFIFEPRDLWVGIYWDRPNRAVTDLYFCLVPTAVLHIRRAVVPPVIRISTESEPS